VGSWFNTFLGYLAVGVIGGITGGVGYLLFPEVPKYLLVILALPISWMVWNAVVKEENK